MRKSLTLFLAVIIFICSTLSGCSYAEAKGVPESVVLRNSSRSLDECSSYEIKHNVDTAAHTDDVTLVLVYDGPYGTNSVSLPYTYEYDRASDLWELIHEGDSSSEYQINTEAYINKPAWTGTSPSYPDYDYSIAFIDIDAKKMRATINYRIDFEDDDIPDLAGTKTVEISDNWGYCIIIDYTYERYIGNGYYSTKEDSIWFLFDMDTGLEPF